MYVSRRVWVLERDGGWLIGTKRFDNYGNREDRYVYVPDAIINEFLTALIKVKEYYKVRIRGFEVLNYNGGYLIVSNKDKVRKIFLYEDDLNELYLFLKEKMERYSV